jgi:hypothetical protein
VPGGGDALGEGDGVGLGEELGVAVGEGVGEGVGVGDTGGAGTPQSGKFSSGLGMAPGTVRGSSPFAPMIQISEFWGGVPSGARPLENGIVGPRANAIIVPSGDHAGLSI